MPSKTAKSDGLRKATRNCLSLKLPSHSIYYNIVQPIIVDFTGKYLAVWKQFTGNEINVHWYAR